MKETWSGIKKNTGYWKPKSPLPSNLDLNELNQFHARFDMIDFSKEIVDERMELNMCKHLDQYSEISKNKKRKEFLNVDAYKPNDPDRLTDKIKKKSSASHLCHIYSHIFNLSLSTFSIPNIWKSSKIIHVLKKEKVTTISDLRPEALTRMVMKCFERTILNHLNKQ